MPDQNKEEPTGAPEPESGRQKNLTPETGTDPLKKRHPSRRVGTGPALADFAAPPALNEQESRVRWGLPAEDDQPGWYMVELNLEHAAGIPAAADRFADLFKEVVPPDQLKQNPPTALTKTYIRCWMSVQQWRTLIQLDRKSSGRSHRAIYKIWPDFPVKPLIDRSIATIKADAAGRTYAATGEGICWAVIDSGIDSTHPHFGDASLNPRVCTLSHPSVFELHRDFTVSGEPSASALTDKFGHGTHVAGIIAGGLIGVQPDAIEVYENVFDSTSDDDGGGTNQSIQKRSVADVASLHGIAPQCKLVSLKVLDDDGNGRASDVIRALAYIRESVNGDPKLLRIHGVNLSIGYEFDAEMFACGQSPLCLEVDRLVKSGVVVVVAAGNTGYGTLPAKQRQTSVVFANTINDPGNSELAITVGATHRDAPHMYGVSYFSSKGPTGDGRIKPDLVAPGERITSCAVGKYLVRNGGDIPDEPAAYIDDSGTSMAAPHVSGAIAAFLSIRREFILRPEAIKQIFMESATSLKREKYFEGSGLIDLMRAIQSV